jgi:hypothetical protein
VLVHEPEHCVCALGHTLASELESEPPSEVSLDEQPPETAPPTIAVTKIATPMAFFILRRTVLPVRQSGRKVYFAPMYFAVKRP